MIKGAASLFDSQICRCSHSLSVMSGIITGPHFRKYFNSPTSLEVGTMVAVLEVGAFSTFLYGFVLCVLPDIVDK